MTEGFLFDIGKDPAEAVLRRNAEDGRLFYSVSECRKYLDLTDCRVRYAIESYRLDALFLAGEYRIPYTAILRFEDSGWLELSIEYLNAHRAIDIDGVYDLNFNGNVGRVVRSLQEKHMPLEIIPHLLEKNRRQEYDKMPGEEEAKEDWYFLDELQLPVRATASEYAGLLGIKPAWLCWDLKGYCGRKVMPSDEVDYPELFDLLVDHEMVNYPIPVQLDYRQAPEIQEEGAQLYLL